MKSVAGGLLTLAGIAAAQQPVYAQCGGQGWTGETACAAGSVCQYQNDYFSQCVPGTASSSTAGTTLVTSVKPSSTATEATSVTATTSTQVSSAPASTASGTFTKADGLKFNIDGVTKYFAGTNCYWCGFLGNPDDADLVLDHMAAAGLKILRIWGFNDVNTKPDSNTVWFQYLSASGSEVNTGANGLERLDYFVQSAGERGIKLIINFVNNWDDYGGVAAYTNAFGGTHQEWYTNTAAHAQYQSYIAAIVGRYQDDPTVLAWELANEPRCNGCDTSVIYDWATTTSAYVKSLDPNHLVTLGDEGFGVAGGDGSYPYTYGEGVDFTKNLGIATLDFGTFHLYPESWGQTFDWGSSWVQTHGAACAAAGKPCLFEEYGAPSDHCTIEKPWQDTSLATNGMASDLFWQFGDTISTGKSSDDTNTLYYGSDDWTCLVTDHVTAINGS